MSIPNRRRGTGAGWLLPSVPPTPVYVGNYPHRSGLPIWGVPVVDTSAKARRCLSRVIKLIV
jgi:hypothetical protein